jgi:hypothetical protein
MSAHDTLRQSTALPLPLPHLILYQSTLVDLSVSDSAIDTSAGFLSSNGSSRSP